MLSIFPLVHGPPYAGDLSKFHDRVNGGDKVTAFPTVVCRAIGHSEQ